MLSTRRVVPSVLIAVGALTVSSCATFSDDSGGGADASDGITVAAAFYPLQYVAQRVAGEDAEVTNLTTPGAEPHDLEMTVEQTAELSAADLVVFEHGFQPSVDEAVEQNATGETVDAADVVELEPFADEHADDEEHADEHDGEDHAEGEEHDHGDLDPHFWQDPLLLADLGDAVASRLSEFDPAGADTYEANADDLRADLEALDAEYADGLASCTRDTIVVSHDAFGYLGKYGLVMAPIAGLSPEAEPTPGDLAELQQLIESDGITTVFSETLAPKALSETLARDTGVETAVLDPIEGLTDESPGDDYVSVMEANLAALQTANDCS